MLTKNKERQITVGRGCGAGSSSAIVETRRERKREENRTSVLTLFFGFYLGEISFSPFELLPDFNDPDS